MFYRSMDCLLKAKDAIESAVYQRLRNLLSVNLKLTFYDIRSTYFHSGLSDQRPRVQPR